MRTRTRLLVLISCALTLALSAYSQTDNEPGLAYGRLRVQADIGYTRETIAVIQFREPLKDEDLPELRVPGKLTALFWESGFWTVRDPYSSLADNLRLIREDVVSGGIEERFAERCCQLIGLKLVATPAEILHFVDHIPGSEVRYLDKPARDVLNLYPREKEIQSVRPESLRLLDHQLAQEADLQQVRFLPTRGSLRVEDVTVDGQPRRRITGEFYWDSEDDMAAFRLNDALGNTDAYEHQVVFRVQQPSPPNGELMRPDDAASHEQIAPYGFYLGSILSANADPGLLGGWDRNFVAVQGHNALGAGTNSELDFTIGSYSAKNSFVPGHWYHYTMTTEPGSYISQFTSSPPDPASTPPTATTYIPTEITQINGDSAKLSGQKITNHCNVPTEGPWCLTTDPILPGPDITCFITGAVPCPIPSEHGNTFTIPVPTGSAVWTWGKPKPLFSVQPVQSTIPVAPGLTIPVRFVVANSSGSDDPVVITVADRGQCGGGVVGILGVSLKAFGQSSFVFNCHIPLGSIIAPSTLRISATAAGVEGTGGLSVALVPASPLAASCSTVPSSVSEGQMSTFKATASGGIAPYRYVWSGAVSGTSQNIGKTFLTAGNYKATVAVIDTSSPPQSKSAQCSVQVNGVAPVLSAPSISGYTLPATPVANQPFSLNLSGSGFDLNMLQVWFFGLTSCQAGCRHPAAGVLNITTTSASLVNVKLAEDTFRIKVRNGDSGPWSAPSDPFQVQAAVAPDFDLTAVLASKTVQAGQGVSFDLRIAPKNAFAGVVTWQLTGLPTNISITNPAQQVTVPSAGAAFSITLQTTSNTPVGAYNLVVTAKSGSLSQSVGLTLAVTQGVAPVSAACQVNGSSSPISVATGTALNYTITPSGGTGPYHFSWIGVSGAGDNSSITVTPSGYASIDVSAQVSDSSAPQLSTTASCPRVTINPPTTGTITVTVPGYPSTVTCMLNGPSGNNYVVAPASLNGQHAGSYTLSCTPPPNFSVTTIGPSATQTLPAGGSISFVVNLATVMPTGTVQVLATMNGQPYSGAMACGFLNSPNNVQVNSVPFSQGNMPLGIYNLNCAGGPPNSQLQSFSPSSSQNLTAGGTITFTAVYVWATVTVYANPLPAPPPGVSWTWQISAWQSSGATWITQPVLTFNGVNYTFSHPAAYIEALKEIQNLGATGPFAQMISDLQNVLPYWPPYTVVNLGPSAPTVSGYYWNNTPQNRVLFSGNISGTGFISGGSEVWFCQTGTSVCYQQPPVGVAVNSSISVSVYNVNLTTGSWQVEVRTSYGTGRGPAFNVQ